MIYLVDDKEYATPEVEIVSLDVTNFVAVSNLENPEDGDEFDW